MIGAALTGVAMWPRRTRQFTVTIICEGCGRGNRLERVLRCEEDIRLVCHDCEEPIGVHWRPS